MPTIHMRSRCNGWQPGDSLSRRGFVRVASCSRSPGHASTARDATASCASPMPLRRSVGGAGFRPRWSAAVRKTHPRAVLALAGDGPLGDELKAQSRALGLEGAVRFLGYRTDVPDLV